MMNHQNIAVLIQQGLSLHRQGNVHDAIDIYERVLKVDPNNFDGLHLLGVSYWQRGNYLKALEFFEIAIKIKPTSAAAHSNKSLALQDLGKLEDALASVKNAIELAPNYAEALSNQGNILNDLRHLEGALNSYENAFLLNPEIEFLFGRKLHAQMQLCNWSGLRVQLIMLFDKIKKNGRSILPFPLLGLTDSLELQKKSATSYLASIISERVEAYPLCLKYVEKIKIGYFSSDFYNHATMHLMAELFESHDKNKFEFIAFSFGPTTNDEWQERARKSFAQFIECSDKSDVEIAMISQAIGVHIAVDLKGFTEDSRTGIFSNRAAPIQVNFIGYPGTMGAEFIDYIVADEVLIPEDSRQFYTEKVAYLPDCYQPNCRTRKVSTKPLTRADFGLPDERIVFCSFNNNYKITPDLFRSWLKILKEVDGSVLWLLTSNASAERNLSSYMEQGGVDPNRLIFAQRLPVEEHLKRLHLADLMLDTFPYGAHTTCSDALRMALPVITLKGESFASRVAASLLTTIDLTELITVSLSDYESLAIKLAKRPDQLKDIRDRLKRSVETSLLFNPEVFARNLESLYERMYERYRDGLEPDHLKGISSYDHLRCLCNSMCKFQ